MCPVLIMATTKIMVNYIYYDVKGVHSNNNVLKILSILFVVSKNGRWIYIIIYIVGLEFALEFTSVCVYMHVVCGGYMKACVFIYPIVSALTTYTIVLNYKYMILN